MPAGTAQGQYRGFWADGFHDGYKTPEQVDKLIADARRARANALFIQVRRRGNSFYTKSLEPPVSEAGYSPQFDALADVVAKAHAAGIEVHAWFAVCPIWREGAAPADPRHVFNLHGSTKPGRENWISLSNTGASVGEGSNYWIDPGHPDAAAYTADVIQHVVENYDVDGIHLDLIRYSGTPWGYNPVSVERFNRLFARTGQPAPGDTQWADFRRQQVTALARKVYLRAVRFRRQVRVSAALISWGDAPSGMADWPRSAAHGTVMQDWANWLREGILDVAVPMNYDRETVAQQRQWFDRWLAFERQNQGRRVIVTGIASYLNSIQGSLAQAGRALATPDGGRPLSGVVFYSYATTDERVNSGAPPALNSEFYAAAGDFFAGQGPATAPELPWKTAPVTGHIFGEAQLDGEPRSSLLDGMRMIAQGPGGEHTATVDGTGAFGWVELDPGPYTVSGFRGNTQIIAPVSVTVRAGEVASLPLSINRTTLTSVIPAPNRGGITNAASYSGAAIAPGSLLSIFGVNLADTTAAATALPLPAALSGVQVLVNGIPAPLLFVSPLQVNAQAPFGLQGQETPGGVSPSGEASVVVRRNGIESAEMRVLRAEAAPGLFNAVLKDDYTPISAGAPAARGGIVLLYATGLGAVTPEVATGVAATAATTIALSEVTVGGRRARVLFSGLAPGFAGLYQLNIEIPPDAPQGGAIAMQLTVAGRSSNTISIPIQ